MDDFGVLYRSKADAKHLEAALTAHYPITTNWTGDRYIGIDLKWNYEKRELITSMKGYVKRALQEFKHPTPTKIHHDPEIFNPPDYGQKQQMEHIKKSQPSMPNRSTGSKIYVESSCTSPEPSTTPCNMHKIRVQ